MPLSHPRDDRPADLVHRLAAQLGHHALWDSLFIFVPPAAALIYVIVGVLFRTMRLDALATLVAVAIVAGLGMLAVALRYRPLVPSISATARLVDQRAGAKDHFLTLATIEPAKWPAAFVSRLQRETSALVQRVELRRDFPYKLKRSAYWSIGVSLIAAVLIHFLSPFAFPIAAQETAQTRLLQLAREMVAKPELKGLARDLEALATKLEDPKVAAEEKQAQARELEKKIEEQQKKEEQKDNRDLLGQAANALQGAEHQQSAGGDEKQKDQQKGGGGIQSNLPQDGQGESKKSQGGSGESKNDSSAQSSTDQQQGKTGQNPKNPSQSGNQQQGSAQEHNQPDPNQPDKGQSQEQVGKSQGGSKDGAGKEQASEQPPPQGTPPADRFYEGGEGKEGLKGARYVTVKLPEEIAADSKGDSRSTAGSKGGRPRPQVPVSNVPLPAHVPNAPSEKQQVPIEYRGMIR